jgi:type IV secretion system protein TrbK
VNRTIIVIALTASVAGVFTATTIMVMNSGGSSEPGHTEEQRAAREKFFGVGKELPPIKDGQEMRPRW